MRFLVFNLVVVAALGYLFLTDRPEPKLSPHTNALLAEEPAKPAAADAEIERLKAEFAAALDARKAELSEAEKRSERASLRAEALVGKAESALARIEALTAEARQASQEAARKAELAARAPAPQPAPAAAPETAKPLALVPRTERTETAKAEQTPSTPAAAPAAIAVPTAPAPAPAPAATAPHPNGFVPADQLPSREVAPPKVNSVDYSRTVNPVPATKPAPAPTPPAAGIALAEGETLMSPRDRRRELNALARDMESVFMRHAVE